MSSLRRALGNHWKMSQAGNLISLEGHRPGVGRDIRNVRNERHRNPFIRTGDELGWIPMREVFPRN